MSSPGAGFLEGLAGGFEKGYGFREGIKDTKRRRAFEDQRSRILDENQRIRQARENRDETEFEARMGEADRLRRLRVEVANYLSSPRRFNTVGEFLSGGEGRRMAPALSEDAVAARDIGRALGRLTGNRVNDEEALLLGTGQIPSSLLRYRDRNIDPLSELGIARATMRARALSRFGFGQEKPPITLDQALRQVTGFFWNTETGQYDFPAWATPAKRLELAKKLQAGTLADADFPQPPEEAVPPPREGFFPRLWHGLFGNDSSEGAPSPQAPPAGPAPPEGPAAGTTDLDTSARVESARALVQSYSDLPPEELRSLLEQSGYTPEEIALILGGGR